MISDLKTLVRLSSDYDALPNDVKLLIWLYCNNSKEQFSEVLMEINQNSRQALRSYFEKIRPNVKDAVMVDEILAAIDGHPEDFKIS